MIKVYVLCGVFAFAGLPSTLLAQEGEEAVASCASFGDLAVTIMTGRQNGVALSTMMEIAAGNDIVRSIILSAYDKPRYSTPSVQNETIQDFRNDVELACYNSQN